MFPDIFVIIYCEINICNFYLKMLLNFLFTFNINYIELYCSMQYKIIHDNWMYTEDLYYL